MIPGRDRIPRSHNTAASATKAVPNTRFEVSAKLKLSWLSTLQRRHSSLICSGKDGNSEETGFLTRVTDWHLHLCCFFAIEVI